MPKIYTNIPPRRDGTVRFMVGVLTYTFVADEDGGDPSCEVENEGDAAELLALPWCFTDSGAPRAATVLVEDEDEDVLNGDLDDDPPHGPVDSPVDSPVLEPASTINPARRRGRPPKAVA